MRRFPNPISSRIVVSAVLLAVVVWIISPAFSDTVELYVKIILGSIAGLVVLGIIVLGLLIWTSEVSQSNAQKKRPYFFEEMQSALQTILLPLGFEMKEGMGWANRTKFLTFTRNEFTVAFWLEVLDSIYHVEMSCKSEVVDGEKRPVPDLSLECVDLRTMDEFKNETINKLNEWLIEKGVR